MRRKRFNFMQTALILLAAMVVVAIILPSYGGSLGDTQAKVCTISRQLVFRRYKAAQVLYGDKVTIGQALAGDYGDVSEYVCPKGGKYSIDGESIVCDCAGHEPVISAVKNNIYPSAEFDGAAAYELGDTVHSENAQFMAPKDIQAGKATLTDVSAWLNVGSTDGEPVTWSQEVKYCPGVSVYYSANQDDIAKIYVFTPEDGRPAAGENPAESEEWQLLDTFSSWSLPPALRGSLEDSGFWVLNRQYEQGCRVWYRGAWYTLSGTDGGEVPGISGVWIKET